MLNWIFLGLITIAVVTAAFTGTMGAVSDAGLASAASAVTLAIELIGQMALWLGFMGILREAGVTRALARGLKPVMTRLFPDVPAEHPAMGAMIMNIAANILNLGNAATPFGLKAMAELDRLNPRRGVATNSMALFLVINNTGVAVLPMTVVAVRAAKGSHDAAGIIVPSLVATMVNTVISVLVCKAFERWSRFSVDRVQLNEPPVPAPASAEIAVDAGPVAESAPTWKLIAVLGVVLMLGFAAVRHVLRSEAAPGIVAQGMLSQWMLPVLMLTIVLVGFGRQVKVYDAFINAAKEGFQTSISVIPYVVAVLVIIGMLRASGALGAFADFVGPALKLVGFPPEAIPMALIRPLSGSGARGVMADVFVAYGPDSFVGYLVSLINNASEATFYVLALYFGSIQVRAVRHTLAACLVSDALHLVVAVAVAHLFF